MLRYSNEELLEMLKKLAESKGSRIIGYTDIADAYRSGVVVNVSTYRVRFGTVGNAVRAAGLTYRERCCSKYSREDVIQALRKLSKKLKRDRLCFTDLRNESLRNKDFPSIYAIAYMYNNSYEKAVIDAGLEYYRKIG